MQNNSNGQKLSTEKVELAVRISAGIVARQGDTYYPIFEKFEAELIKRGNRKKRLEKYHSR